MDITSPPPTANLIFEFEFDKAQQLLEVEVEVMLANNLDDVAAEDLSAL